MHEKLGRGMVELIGMNRLQEADIIDNLAEMRQQVRDPGPRLAVLLERGLWPQHLGHAHNKGEALAVQERLGAVEPVEAVKVWLMVEEFELRRSTGHV